MRKLIVLIGLILPLHAYALEFRNLSLLYTDAPFVPAEAAGISLLTSIDAISGYPDGTFKPNRTLNRAEFLKIALASYPKIRVSPSDAEACFPDVSEDDWFSQYVCLAKKRGIIKGYPDGDFKPARTVNYAEALKMLSEIYEYVAYSAPDEPWYAGYVRAAQFNKTALPASIAFDRALTRGQMARLAAAYRAQYEGELELYRLSERSFDAVVMREIADRAQGEEMEEEIEEIEEIEDSSEDGGESISLPATSHFLLLGTDEIIASGHFVPRGEMAVIENITIKFREEVKNIAALYLVDEAGTQIATLTKDIVDRNELTWKAQTDAVEHYVLPAEGLELALKATIKDIEQGHSEELIQVKWMSMNVSALQDRNKQYQLIAQDPSYPPHQTAMAHMTNAYNNRPPILDLREGDDVLLAEFGIEGETMDSAPLSVDSLTFTIVSEGVTLDNFTLGVLHDTDTTSCSLGEGIFISCTNIPSVMGYLDHDSVVFQLHGSMAIDPSVSDPYLRIDLDEPGTISTTIDPGTLGHLLWSDGTGNFRWVDLEKPMARGSEWK